MLLRNGKTITTTSPITHSVSVKSTPKSKSKSTLDDDLCNFTASGDYHTFLSEFRAAMSAKPDTFMDKLIRFEHVFTCFNQNIDVITLNTDLGNILWPVIRGKIKYWNTNIAQKFTDNIMLNPQQSKEISEQLMKTQKAIKFTEAYLESTVECQS